MKKAILARLLIFLYGIYIGALVAVHFQSAHTLDAYDLAQRRLRIRDDYVCEVKPDECFDMHGPSGLANFYRALPTIWLKGWVHGKEEVKK